MGAEGSGGDLVTADPIPPRCPFRVGDAIKAMGPTATVTNPLTGETTVYPSDRVLYVATVTAVRDDPPEFDYVYPCTVPLVPRWGWSTTGGTCFANGFHTWMSATDEELTAYADSWLFSPASAQTTTHTPLPLTRPPSCSSTSN